MRANAVASARGRVNCERPPAMAHGALTSGPSQRVYVSDGQRKPQVLTLETSARQRWLTATSLPALRHGASASDGLRKPWHDPRNERLTTTARGNLLFRHSQRAPAATAHRHLPPSLSERSVCQRRLSETLDPGPRDDASENDGARKPPVRPSPWARAATADRHLPPGLSQRGVCRRRLAVTLDLASRDDASDDDGSRKPPVRPSKRARAVTAHGNLPPGPSPWGVCQRRLAETSGPDSRNGRPPSRLTGALGADPRPRSRHRTSRFRKPQRLRSMRRRQPHALSRTVAG